MIEDQATDIEEIRDGCHIVRDNVASLYTRASELHALNLAFLGMAQESMLPSLDFVNRARKILNMQPIKELK
jgi:hypothetical protein